MRTPAALKARLNRLSITKRRQILDEGAKNPGRSVLTTNTIDPAKVDMLLFGHHKSASPRVGFRLWVFETDAKANRFKDKYKDHLR